MSPCSPERTSSPIFGETLRFGDEVRIPDPSLKYFIAAVPPIRVFPASRPQIFAPYRFFLR